MDRLRNTGLYSTHGRLLRIDLVLVWRSFNSDVELGLHSFHAGALCSVWEMFAVLVSREPSVLVIPHFQVLYLLAKWRVILYCFFFDIFLL